MGLPLLNDAGSCADCLCTRGCLCHVGNAAKTAVALDCTAGPAGEYRPCRRFLDGSSYQRHLDCLLAKALENAVRLAVTVGVSKLGRSICYGRRRS